MDVDARLESLLTATRWVRDARTAHALVPSIATAAPPLVAVADQRSDREPVVPVLDAQVLIDPLLDLLAEVGAAMVAGAPSAPVESLSDEALRADPLVMALRDHVSRGGAGGLGRGAVPALTLAWASGRLLQGEDLAGLSVEPARKRALSELRGWLARQEPAARGAALSTITWEMSGRMAAALQLARQADPHARADALSRAVLSRPALLGVSRRTWAEQPDFVLLGALMGIEADPGPLQWVQPALRAAVQASDARAAKGKATGADAALTEARRATGDPAGVERLAFHPVHAAYALGALPDLVTAKDLKAVGVPADPARLMIQRPGALALAAAWSELLGPLLEWDLLSALIDRVVPIWRDTSGAVVSAKGPVRGGVRLGMLAPRPKEETEACAVVAIRLTELQSSLRGALGAPCPGAAAAAFAAVARAQMVPAHAVVADHGVAAFRDTTAALDFALTARAALAGPRAAHVGGVEVSLSADASVSVGLARGVVTGGSDGLRAVLGGPGVGEAVGLTGNGPSPLIANGDTLGVRRAGLSAAGFANGGVVCSGDFLSVTLDALRRKRAALHVQGEAGSAGGLAKDFQLYPAVAWWDLDDERAVLALAFADPPGNGPAAELQVLPADALRELHRSDAEAAAIQQRVAPAPAVGHGGAAADPFADSSDAPAAAPAAAASPALEPLDSVFGFAAEPEPQSKPAEASAPPPAVDEDPTGDVFAFEATDPSLDDGFETRSADDEIDDELGEGLLDAFSREGGSGETPVLAAFDGGGSDTPLVGTLALLDDDDDGFGGADAEPDHGPEVGRLAMFEADADGDANTLDTGPTVAAPPELSTSTAPMVDIEDDWDDDDSWDSEEAEEGVLTDDFDDGDGGGSFGFAADGGASSSAQLDEGFAFESTLDEPEPAPFAFEAPEDEEDDAFAFEAPEADDEGDDPFAFEAPEADDEDDDPFAFEAPEADDEDDDDDAFTFEAPGDAPETQAGAEGDRDDDSADAAFAFVEEPDDGGLNFPRGDSSLNPEAPSGDFAFSFDPVEPEPEPAPEPEAPTRSIDDDPLLGELVRMFQNYKVVEQGGAFTFGIRDGERIRDALRFDTAGDAVRAYQEFLQYKIRHGFVTEAHKVADVEPGAAVGGIDGQLLRRAYVEVAR